MLGQQGYTDHTRRCAYYQLIVSWRGISRISPGTLHLGEGWW